LTARLHPVPATEAQAAVGAEEAAVFLARAEIALLDVHAYVCYVDRFYGALAALPERLDHLAKLGTT
jgi:hypothetical protein